MTFFLDEWIVRFARQRRLVTIGAISGWLTSRDQRG